MGIIGYLGKTYKDAWVIRLLFAFWFISTLGFYSWWFQPVRLENLTGLIAISANLLWFTILSLYSFITLLKLKTQPENLISSTWKIAMVVTKAPSEPLSLVQKTLKAMLSMDIKHDTWIADENPTPEALEWYKSNGVKVSTRKHAPDYHNETWPRRTKCKEGNLAYFYDKYGYENYDFVVQMDSDHVPHKDYLKYMISPFSNKKVGYVAAPSICNNNQSSSWASRARMHSESMFHGPMQSGNQAPVCIGSHYAVRTKALKEIGGLGPELAEDFSTTVMMNAKGWKGEWAYNAVATGDGPNTFTDLIIQDYQWSKSLVSLLVTFFGKHWNNLNWSLKIQFLLAQVWYPISAILWTISMMIPLTAITTNTSPVEAQFINFAILYTIPFIITLITFFYMRSHKLLRPYDVKLFSWENLLFEATRWPWVLIACIDAVYSVVSKKKTTFKVTPKGEGSAANISMKIFYPYFIITILGAGATFYGILTGTGLYGYLIMCAAITIFYSLIISIIMLLHIKENYDLEFFSNPFMRLQTANN